MPMSGYQNRMPMSGYRNRMPMSGYRIRMPMSMSGYRIRMNMYANNPIVCIITTEGVEGVLETELSTYRNRIINRTVGVSKPNRMSEYRNRIINRM